jgi:hypothetical protein
MDYSIQSVNNRRQSDYLKVIAMVTMLIDHVAYFLVPHGTEIYFIMRIIGRIAYPIFAYYVAMGYKHTSDINRYMVRMLIFALISQIPFYFFSHGTFYLNVMFTFFMALLMLRLYEKGNLIWVVVLFLADVIHMDYGAYGLLIILIFYRFADEKRKVYGLILVLTLLYNSLNALQAGYISWQMYLQVFCVMALPFIYKEYKYIRINRYISYLFYPVHIGLIVLVGYFI